MTRLTRREFLAGAAAACAAGCTPTDGRRAAEAVRKPLKFLFMTDHHVESDFVQSFGATKGRPSFTCWKPGNHAAIVETYKFINRDPFCRDIAFALFGGDQINTGYLSHAADRDAEMANYWRTLRELDIYRNTKGTDVSELKFRTVPSFVCGGNLAPGQAPVTFRCPPLDSRVIAIQGNHDTGVGEFYRECAFQCGGVRFITFFASYVGLKSPRPDVFLSTAKISDAAIGFIAEEMARAAADPDVRHIVLCSHWAIAPKGKDFSCPIIGPCEENKMNANRDKLLALAERFGCRLHINGHEHRGDWPVGRVGSLSDINCGTLADGRGGAFAVVEIDDAAARFHVYSRAQVKETADGQAVLSAEPRELFIREIPLI